MRTVRPLLLVSVLAVLLPALAPRIVEASCGDWLSHAEPPSLAGVSLLVAREQVPPNRELPCDGPQCRKSPPSTPLAPTSEPLVWEKCVIAPAAWDSPDAGFATRFPPPPGAEPCAGQYPGLERPPRS